jgi:hypothetical protein
MFRHPKRYEQLPSTPQNLSRTRYSSNIFFVFDLSSIQPLTKNKLSYFEFVAMCRLAVLFLFILIYSPQLDCSKFSDLLAPHAIKGVIDEYFAKNEKDVHLLNFGMSNGKASEVIDECLKLAISSMPVVFYSVGTLSSWIVLDRPSVLLFDSLVRFEENLEWLVFQEGLALSFPHLVYIHGATLEDIQIASYKNNKIDKTIFLVNETPQSIELATAFLFTPQACHKNQFKVINRFTRTQMKWENTNFFVLKYRNLHGCPLIFRSSGEHLLLYSKLAIELNFTMDFSEEDFNLNQEITFGYGYVVETVQNPANMHIIDIEPRKIFIPPGEVYGDYEKMTLPFDTATWIGIVLMIVVCSSVIFLIKKFNQTNQAIFFGRNNKSPFMNFVAVLLNGAQHTTLVENVPRMFLLTFIIWSLIFRQESSLKPLSY